MSEIKKSTAEYISTAQRVQKYFGYLTMTQEFKVPHDIELTSNALF